MRGMNGSSGTSPDRGYSGGIPTPVVPPPMGLGGPQGPGLHGSAAAAAAAACLGGPELKHHADFLSRLLAATPSYMSEMGNPPPGFFSDWLRRLVSKPGGNTSQSSGLTFPGQQPEGESSAGGSGRSATVSNTPQLDAPPVSSKRRKRSRLNDHPPEHSLGGSSTANASGQGTCSDPDRPTSAAGHHHHPPHSSSGSHVGGGPLTSSASSSSAAAQQQAAAAAAFPSLGAYPFWFFPPFLPNPYGMGMNMGMNFPGAPTSPAGSGLSAAAQAAAISSYLGGTSPSDLFRTDNLNLLSGSITSTGSSGSGRVGGPGHSPHSLPHPFQLPPGGSMDPGAHLNNPHHQHHHLKLSAAGRILENSPSGNKQESPPGSAARSPSSHKDSSPSSFLAAAAAAASASFLQGGSGGSASVGNMMSSGKHSNQQLPSPSSSHYGSNSNNNHNGVAHKMTTKSPPGSNHHGHGNKSNNNKSSFSISRLTSPSPSSNSSGGSCSGSNLGNSKYHGGQHHSQQQQHRSGSGHRSRSYEDIKLHGPQHHQQQQQQPQLPSMYSGSSNKSEESVLKSNLNSGPKMPKDSSSSTNTTTNSTNSSSADAGLCVDLRVSGRIWETGVVPPPRSIYTPCYTQRNQIPEKISSAFRDPAENLFISSQVPKYDPHHPAHTTDAAFSGNIPPPPQPHNLSPHPLLQQKTQQQQQLSGRSYSVTSPNSAGASANAFLLNAMTAIGATNNSTKEKNLSTKYVLRNIQHIYQRLRPASSPPLTKSNTASPNPNQITTSHPINNHHSPSPSTKAGSPPSGQSDINHHHHPLNSDNKNNTTSHNNKSKKTNRDSTNSPQNNASNPNPTKSSSSNGNTPVESETEDNNVIIPNDSPRPHSSSSSTLDDEDFKPEAELKMAIKDDTLNPNLSLNNNVEKKNEMKDLVVDSPPNNNKSSKTSKNSTLTEKKARRKSTELGTETQRLIQPSSKKRKSGFSSGGSSSFSDKQVSEQDINSGGSVGGVVADKKSSGKEENSDNPYNFVDVEESSINKPPKLKKIKKENNNEIETGEDEEDLSSIRIQPLSSKKIKISIGKVKSETSLEDRNRDEELEKNELLNLETVRDEGTNSEILNVSEPDIETQSVLEC